MPINLAHHLKVSRHGVFYFRMAVPAALRPYIGKREVIKSLRTRDPATARKLAYTFASHTYEWFSTMAYDPKRFDPFDVSTFPTAKEIRPYEIDLARGILKSEGPDDHARMMEALAVMKSIPAAQPVTAPAPAQWTEPMPAHTITLSKALAAYGATLLNDKTRNATEREINKFIEHCGDIEIHKVRGVDVTNWNAKLLAGVQGRYKPVMPRTADNSIQFLQGLLKWAQKNEYIHSSTKIATEGKANLTKSQRIKATQGAEDFSVEQLVKIFDPSTYKAYCGQSLGRYWIPLIALHTGMRLEEIAQLTSEDIKAENGSGVLYIDINRNGGKSVKTQTALRNIPIHDTLLDLGFMEFVRSRKGKPGLFHESGSAVSHAFIRYIESIGVKDKNDKRTIVFHSFRDTFNNRLADPSAAVPERLRYALMGHSRDSDTNATNYTKTITVKESKEWVMDRLVFEESAAGGTHTLNLNPLKGLL